MKNYLLGVFAMIIGCTSFISCSEDDLCTQTVTYRKGEAIYADLNLFRSDDVNSQPRNLENPGKIFISTDLMLIGEGEAGIHIIDNSDPSNPVFINFLNIPGNREFAVKESKLFADSYYDLLQIDISQPLEAVVEMRIEEAFPVRLSNSEGHALIDFDIEETTETLPCSENVHEDIWQYFDFLGQRIPESALPTSFVSNGTENFGTVNRMAIVDDYMYVIGLSDFYVFQDIDNIISKSFHQEYFSHQMETIYPMDNYLFIGSLNSMSIYDISQPNAPAYVSAFQHATSCDPVLPTEDGLAYVTLRSGDECPGDENTLNIIDIDDIQRPFLVSSIEMDSPYAMSIHDNVLYVGEGSNGFRSFSIDGRRLTPLIHNQQITAYDIIPHPVRNDILVFAGPAGITQYTVDNNQLTIVSEIGY